MKTRAPAKTIWLGLLCLGALTYLLGLGQVNIRQFERKLTLQSQQTLLHLAQARSRHFSDLLTGFEASLRSRAASFEAPDVPQNLVGGLTDFGPAASAVLSFDRLDSRGGIVERYGGSFWGPDIPYEPFVEAFCQGHPALDAIGVRMVCSSEPASLLILHPLSQGTTFSGMLALRISLESLLAHLERGVAMEDIRICLMDDHGRTVAAADDAGGRAAFAVPAIIASEILQADVRQGRWGTGRVAGAFEGQTLLAGHWPLAGFQAPWSIAVVRDDRAVRTAVAEHARNIQLGMVCLFLTVFLIWALFYRCAQRRVVVQQQTALGQATRELHHVSEQNRQIRQRLERQTALYRGLLDAVPMGLYWKDSDGHLVGYNAEYAHIAGCKPVSDDGCAIQTELFELKQEGLPLDMEVMNKDIELLFLPQTFSQHGFSRHYLVSKIAVKNPDGRVCGLLGGLLNKELLKTAQDRCFCTTLRSRCASELLATPTLVLNRRGRVLHGNAAFWARLGIDPPADIRRLNELMTVEPSDAVDTLIDRLEQTQSEQVQEIEVQVGSDHLRLSARPIFEDDKFVAVLLEILEQHSVTPEGAPDNNNGNPAFNQEALDMYQNTPSNNPHRTLPSARILMVDDVQENRTLLEVILSRLGHMPVHCAGDREAVSLCQAEKYDLVLMDIQMPDISGLEATRQIRTDGPNTATPIIAMTASDQKDDELAALESGCDDYLTKPINRRQLEQKVWRHLAKMHQIAEAEQGLEITSFLEGDPDYQKTIETFVSNLPGRLADIRTAFEQRDFQDLAFKVHALKRLGGFAGFAVYTEKAARLEESLRQQDVDKIQARIDEMMQLCMRTKIKSDIL